MKAIVHGRDPRSHAARPLSNLTTGTAVLGVVATGAPPAIAPSLLAIDLACLAAVAVRLAWRILPRGTINLAGTTRLTTGDGG
jgi:hypothetical protein